MALAFDVTSVAFFVTSVAALPPPLNGEVLPALYELTASNLSFEEFAAAFNWREVPIEPVDTFPGNERLLHAFDMQLLSGVVTVTVESQDDGVVCLTAY